MKIQDILPIENMKPEFKEDVYMYEITESLDININCDTSKPLKDLVAYRISSWLCTDTLVGMKIYYLNNEPVAYSKQDCRKCYENFVWVSMEAYNKLIAYLYTFDTPFNKLKFIEDFPYVEDTYKILYNGNLYKYHYDIPYLNGIPVKIIELEKKTIACMATKVKIQSIIDLTEEWVDVGELDFPYNLKT